MDVESGLLIAAITALTSALVYLYKRSEAINAAIKKDLDEALERERNHRRKKFNGDE